MPVEQIIALDRLDFFHQLNHGCGWSVYILEFKKNYGIFYWLLLDISRY